MLKVVIMVNNTGGNWQKVKLTDFVYINPTEKLSKGTVAKKIAMENLEPFCRDISKYEVSLYNGGVKFGRNGIL